MTINNLFLSKAQVKSGPNHSKIISMMESRLDDLQHHECQLVSIRGQHLAAQSRPLLHQALYVRLYQTQPPLSDIASAEHLPSAA